MNEFEKFLEENNYKDDLEFQLCDLKVAFNAGKELQWKPTDEQMKALKEAYDKHWELDGLDPLYTLYQDLKKLKGE